MNKRDRETLAVIRRDSESDRKHVDHLRQLPSKNLTDRDRALIQRQALLDIIDRLLADQADAVDRIGLIGEQLETIEGRLKGSMYELQGVPS